MSLMVSFKDFLGFKVVYCLQKECKVDIIFVYGLGGSSCMIWMKDYNFENFWLFEYLLYEFEIGDVCILVFGYNVKFKLGGGGLQVMLMLDFVKELFYDFKYVIDELLLMLEDFRLGERLIIFLVYLMGGFIVKEVYMQGKDDFKYVFIIKVVLLIIFLFILYCGMNFVEIFNWIFKVFLVVGLM